MHIFAVTAILQQGSDIISNTMYINLRTRVELKLANIK